MARARRAIFRLTVIGLAVSVLVIAGRLYLTPFFYQYRDFRSPVWGWKCKYIFSRYTIPPGYKQLDYVDSRKGPVEPTKLLLFKNTEKDHLLLVCQLREYLTTPSEKLRVSSESFPWSKFTLTYGVGGDWDDKRSEWMMPPEFEFIHLLPPLLLDQTLRHAGKELILRGINSSTPLAFETAKTNVWYVQGKFTKLGFFKEPRGVWRFPTPVFDFKRNMTGAVAVIQDNATGQTVIAVGAAPQPQPFDEPEFRGVVQSLTFDAEPVPDPTAGLPIHRTRGPLHITFSTTSLLKIAGFLGLILIGFWAYRHFRA